jgi:hypothetical protein
MSNLEKIRAWHAARSREFEERRLSVNMDTFEAASMVGMLLEALAHAERALGDMTRYRDTCQRQLDKVDEALPPWKGLGEGGRIDTINALRTRLAEAERQLQIALTQVAEHDVEGGIIK